MDGGRSNVRQARQVEMGDRLASTVPRSRRPASIVMMTLGICAAIAAQHARGVLALAAPVAASPAATPAAGSAMPGGPAAATTPTPTPTPVPVVVDKDGFHPSTVRVISGQEVEWTNNDAKTTHTATAADGSWDTGPIEPGKSQVRQFYEPGRWDYLDGFNPVLRAVLIVATPSPTGVTAPGTRSAVPVAAARATGSSTVLIGATPSPAPSPAPGLGG